VSKEQGPVQSSRQVRLGAVGGHDGDPVAEDASDPAACVGDPGTTTGCTPRVGRSSRARARACWMQTGQVPVRMKYTATARAWPR
jgi:hypothetical protein